MGQVVSIHARVSIKDAIISTATPSELFERLVECDREIGDAEGIVDTNQTLSPAALDAYRKLDSLRCERADIEAALSARFLMWSGGITAAAFLERLG